MTKAVLAVGIIIAALIVIYMFLGGSDIKRAEELCSADEECVLTIGSCDCYAVSVKTGTTAKDIEGGKVCAINKCLIGVLQPKAACVNNVCQKVEA